MKRNLMLAWVLTLVPLSECASGGLGVKRRKATEASQSPEAKVEEKLRSIIIPKIYLRQASVHEVVEFLVKTSQQLDPEREGVNIILNLGSATKPLGGAARLPESRPRARKRSK
jgi:hypothetical protein